MNHIQIQVQCLLSGCPWPLSVLLPRPGLRLLVARIHSRSALPSSTRADALAAYRHHLAAHPGAVAALLGSPTTGLLPVCRALWAPPLPGESLDAAIELQRRALALLLRHALARPCPSRIRDTLVFLTASPLAPTILVTLGLDPLRGWRNRVPQPLRLALLAQLVGLVGLLPLPPADWWEAQLALVLSQPPRSELSLAQLHQLALALIVALAKQGSAYQALRLSRSLHRLLPPRPAHPFLSEDVPVSASDPASAVRRAATGLVLAEALVAKKRIQDAHQVISTLPSIIMHPIHQRYILTLLSIKSALGDFQAVQSLGQTYIQLSRTSNSNNPSFPEPSFNGRNVRKRSLLRQPAHLTVACAKIEALSVSGRLAEATEVFRQTLNDLPSELSSLDPIPVAELYAEMMKAHVAVNELEEAQALADQLPPSTANQRHFNLLLQGYAARADLQKCADVLEKMIQLGVPADMHVYANVCVVFANIREPESVLQVIERVLARAWEPRRELWNILLDSYVEAADWSRAARLLTFLETDDAQRARTEPDQVTKGIILKALVLSGAPTDEVVEAFKALFNERAGGGPADARAYTLLLQSVCDAGMMDLAEAIFFSLKEHTPSGVEPNVFMYGIMICAFLRLGRKSLAQFYFQDMKQYGLRPSSIIYSMITAAYARSSGEMALEGEGGVPRDGVELAREMVQRFKKEMESDGLLDEMVDPSSPEEMRATTQADAGSQQQPSRLVEQRIKRRQRRLVAYDLPSVRHQASHRLLAPIIQAYVKSARPAKALEVVKELVKSLGSADQQQTSTTGAGQLGQLLDIDVYTMLLDGYRRAQDPAGVMEIWQRIFSDAVAARNEEGPLGAARARLLSAVSKLAPSTEISKSTSPLVSKVETEAHNKPKKHILCLPLSIYTASLASHGFHKEVAMAWEDVQSQGFAFDPANFNHLCVACFKSGNSKLAWEIVEKVLFGDGEMVSESDGGDIEQVENTDGGSLAGSGSSLLSPSSPSFFSSGGTSWPKFLKASVPRRRRRAGIEGEVEGGFSGVEESDGPGRPPNRTWLRKTQRFDDQTAARGALESLLDSLRSPAASFGNGNDVLKPLVEEVGGKGVDCGDSGTIGGGRWSSQVEGIGKARRLLAWKPYGKVLRMLHGSLWRECSNEVLKRNHLKNEGNNITDVVNGGSDEEDKRKILLEDDISKILTVYYQKYPKSMKAMFFYALGHQNGNVLFSKTRYHDHDDYAQDQKYEKEEEWVNWAMKDFVIRVIGRTRERMVRAVDHNHHDVNHNHNNGSDDDDDFNPSFPTS